MGQEPLEHLHLVEEPLVPALGGLLGLVHPAGDHFRIGQNELQVDDVDVPQRICGALHMGHIGIVEAADHVDNGVGGADVGEKFVAQALALGGALHKPCDVHKLNDCRGELLGLMHLPQPLQPLVRDRNHPHVGVDGAKGVVIRRNPGAGNGVEEGGLAHIGQANDS